MDIWNWVEKLQDDLREAGQPQNAQLLSRFTDHVSDLQVERAEALLPEARALGKTLRNPWLEVFVGHWEMRNRVGNLCEGERALGDAVALFERAHRADAAECPQSVCVTQDLAACYANVDGPGWAGERIEVCDETLAKINPGWSCFQCVSCERADAMQDGGRGDAALDYLQAQSQAILSHGGSVYDGIPEMRIKILLDLGRAEEALALVEQREAEVEGGEWANCSQPRQLQKAHALALLGRDDAAMEALPPWRQIAPAYRRTWLRVVALLVARAPERNSWDLGNRVQQTLEHFSRAGAHRVVIELATLAVEMALQRGAVWVARRHLALARRHLPQLRQDLGAAVALDALAAAIDNAPAQAPLPVPVPAEQLLGWLEAQSGEEQPRDPEREVQWLLQALEQRPEDADLLGVTASALAACAADDEAIALLWRYLERHADTEQPLAYRLLELLLARDADAEVRRLAQLFRAQVPVTACWAEMQLARKNGDWPALEQAAGALLALSPQSHGARNLLARTLRDQGRFAEAVECYRHLTEVLEEPRAAYWDLMTAASAAGDWTSVRAAAATLEMPVDPGEGVIEEDWGWVIVRCVENGDPLEFYARRTGPVTARIAENAPANRSQHVGDWVVFDAELVHPAPEDEEERKRFIPTYALVHVLQSGGFARSWLVDGAHPGDEAFAALREAIEARGWKLWVHSRDDYQVTNPDSGEVDLPGIYFTVALPQDVPALELHQLLAGATAGWTHPLCWLRLAEACGQDDEAQMEIIRRYGL